MRALEFDLPRAVRAMRKLTEDPDDLPQVFTIVESLSFDTLHRAERRLAKSESGRRLLRKRPDIVQRLADRAALARAPEGSLARAYLRFVERENISAEGLRAASAKGTSGARLPPPYDWIRQHLNDTHDLWHAATGYAGDVLGETALLAFIVAQLGNPAAAFIVAVGAAKLHDVPGGGLVAWRAIADGFHRGRRAAWLPEQDWESLLDHPLADVRRELRLGAPPHYREIRSHEYRAAKAMSAPT